MREEGLEVVYNRRRRRWSSYAGEVSAAPPNLVARDFSAPAPDELWVTDITEFRIPAGKAYLSAVVDCFDGRPAGWRIGPSPTAALANGSLADAVAAVLGYLGLADEPGVAEVVGRLASELAATV